jgi:hypothetical protein
MQRSPNSAWLSVKCPTCGAEVGQECYETDRLWGKQPTPDGQEHQARILLVLKGH